MNLYHVLLRGMTSSSSSQSAPHGDGKVARDADKWFVIHGVNGPGDLPIAVFSGPGFADAYCTKAGVKTTIYKAVEVNP